jgi:hypothetical protein
MVSTISSNYSLSPISVFLWQSNFVNLKTTLKHLFCAASKYFLPDLLKAKNSVNFRTYKIYVYTVKFKTAIAVNLSCCMLKNGIVPIE